MKGAKLELQSLEVINRALWTYIEIEYHGMPHRILRESPLDRWAKIGQRVRYPEPSVDINDLFLFEAKRKVQKDRTVSLNGMLYEIDASLVGETVTLRYVLRKWSIEILFSFRNINITFDNIFYFTIIIEQWRSVYFN